MRVERPVPDRQPANHKEGLRDAEVDREHLSDRGVPGARRFWRCTSHAPDHAVISGTRRRGIAWLDSCQAMTRQRNRSTRPSSKVPRSRLATHCRRHATARLKTVGKVGLALALVAGIFAAIPDVAGALAPNSINTVAGGGGGDTVTNGEAATAVDLNTLPSSVSSVVTDRAGDLFIAAQPVNAPGGPGYDFPDLVLELPSSSGNNFGIPMTAGDIYIIAGNQSWGSSGDGGPATSASFGGPE